MAEQQPIESNILKQVFCNRRYSQALGLKEKLFRTRQNRESKRFRFGLKVNLTRSDVFFASLTKIKNLIRSSVQLKTISVFFFFSFRITFYDDY